MRFALLATSSLVALSLAAYACSSSDSTPSATPDAGKGTSTSSSGSKGDDDDTTSSSGGASSGNSSSGTTSSSGASSSGTTSSSGSTTSSGGEPDSGAPIDGGSAGTLCTAGSQVEDTTKDNDTADKAQTLTPTTGTATTTFCGRVSSATDHDFWTYTFNIAGAGSFSSNLSSSATPGVTVKVSVDGGAFVDFAALSEFKPGKPYVFDVSRAAGAADYRITMSIKQN